MATLFINGKFLTQRITGVQRFARNGLLGLDAALAASPGHPRPVLLRPAGAAPMDGLRFIAQRAVGPAGCHPTLWEQWVLPWHARSGTLLCLSGSAPLFARRCIPTIHDAAVYLHPQAYTAGFIAWYRLLFAANARRSPLMLTVSQTARQDLLCHLPHARLEVVPNAAEHILDSPADHTVLQRLQLQPGRYLLAVGSLNPTKNFDTLVRAFAVWPLKHQFPLVVVGGIHAQVFRTTRDTPVDADVCWAGPVEDPQLRALYENAALFIFPSVYEGFGIPPLEAMHCQCPVVASNASSVPEVCGDAACYVDPLDGQAMMQAVERVLTQPALRDGLVARGRARAAQFSRAQVGRDLLRALSLAQAIPAGMQ